MTPLELQSKTLHTAAERAINAAEAPERSGAFGFSPSSALADPADRARPSGFATLLRALQRPPDHRWIPADGQPRGLERALGNVGLGGSAQFFGGQVLSAPHRDIVARFRPKATFLDAGETTLGLRLLKPLATTGSAKREWRPANLVCGIREPARDQGSRTARGLSFWQQKKVCLGLLDLACCRILALRLGYQNPAAGHVAGRIDGHRDGQN